MTSADATQEQENVAAANEANAKAANDSQLGSNEGRPKGAQQQWPANKVERNVGTTDVLSIEDRVTILENELADFKRRVAKKINSV